MQGAENRRISAVWGRPKTGAKSLRNGFHVANFAEKASGGGIISVRSLQNSLNFFGVLFASSDIGILHFVYLSDRPIQNRLMLNKELQYFSLHQDRFVQEHAGEYVVIVGEDVIGFYETEIDAYTDAIKNHPLGSFLIRLCVPPSEQPTANFYTGRAVFG